MVTSAEETYLFLLEGEVVGFLTLGAARDPDIDIGCTGEIWGIYVSPGYWRKGIGKQLGGEAERILKSRGYDYVILWVLEDNVQARRFYEVMGYGLDGESKNIDWGTESKAVRYRKALQPVGETNT